MNLTGKYRESNGNWLGSMSELGIIQIGKTQNELFDNLIKDIDAIINTHDEKEKPYQIKINEDKTFNLKFLEHKIFSSFIFKALRRNEKISQSKVASRLDVVRSSYSQYEERKKDPTITKFCEIMESFGYECEISFKKTSSL
ncbi:helix-turn-helix domain-containing protein [Silvanigrella paludirubra]|uniref:Helix-turn-helix domain-containing protein n=1 Tax=Silvanigrella paludirubra TaxID=2499159 RepID=A0A6N6VTC7_9BACT|nr:helix-turn-helix transcriptional regulator [Silvanigrella paludirubra]KAB8039128.1 helix-turn-helix domain-containing protein [Silvanigrella paludirubra]